MSTDAPTLIPERRFMELAIEAAQDARKQGDYAIGAVVVLDSTILSVSGNRVKIDNDPTQHAEVAAIRLACLKQGTRHLEGAVLYTTAEPCPMCTSAAIWARMSCIVAGSTITDMVEFRRLFGNPEWTWRTVDIAARMVIDQGEPKLHFIDGFMREECQALFHES